MIRVHCDAVTRQGQGMRNEDRMVALPEQQLYAVIDGVSGLEPIVDELGCTAGEIAAIKIAEGLQSIVGQASEACSAMEIMRSHLLEANRELDLLMRKYNIASQETSRRFGAVHAAVWLDEHYAYWTQTGDCMIYARYDSGRVRAVTNDRVAAFDDHALREWMNHEEEWRKHRQPDAVRSILLHNRAQANAENGYSVLNGDEAVQYRMECGALPLQGITHLLLVSDGIYPWHVDQGQSCTECWFQSIIEKGMERYAVELEEHERKDERCNTMPRFKMCDDKTGILLTIEEI
ncbi:protein phosphatase 2C domain-containing protein [Paenibacillus alvei]|uniref:protein phosphatase 2C domain-containing protein n=1 Tax=Paenibacillus alvei TaxID=44250 RepID=UPI0018CD6041|nr:protein phosphatase 2C domain-containing protein [Paenibacillus alvei]MCY9580428.1 protein phosphatase 2C domain-containing protein [Paenibacillus alvei]MCY9583246.1 protein phosphatase 2C domain-containing protein [Paenibacillus alvei]